MARGSLGANSLYGAVTSDKEDLYLTILTRVGNFALEYCDHDVRGRLFCHLPRGRDYLHSDLGTVCVILFWDSEEPNVPYLALNCLCGDSRVSCLPPL